MIVQLSKPDKKFLLKLTKALVLGLSLSSSKADPYAIMEEIGKAFDSASELADVAPKPELGGVVQYGKEQESDSSGEAGRTLRRFK